MPTLNLKVREDKTVNVQAMNDAVRSLVEQQGLTTEQRVNALIELMARMPRRRVHDADILIDVFGAMQKRDGESFREQLTRLKIGEKLYAYSGATEPASVSVTENERQWIQSRLNDSQLKLGSLPVWSGLCLLDMIEQLNLRVDEVIADDGKTPSLAAE
jgi:hypothetical protein